MYQVDSVSSRCIKSSVYQVDVSSHNLYQVDDGLATYLEWIITSEFVIDGQSSNISKRFDDARNRLLHSENTGVKTGPSLLSISSLNPTNSDQCADRTAVVMYMLEKVYGRQIISDFLALAFKKFSWASCVPTSTLANLFAEASKSTEAISHRPAAYVLVEPDNFARHIYNAENYDKVIECIGADSSKCSAVSQSSMTSTFSDLCWAFLNNKLQYQAHQYQLSTVIVLAVCGRNNLLRQSVDGRGRINVAELTC
uniref:Uncharacterized protein n=1 Tax=Ditylenchus dipsaci TaxID=166011 RepID=A0A915DKZ4_9BILA